MSINHIVLLTFKPSIEKKDIENIMLSLYNLRKSIPQIKSFSWGENNSPENLHRGYSYGFVMEFEDETDRQIYLDHPQHIEIKEKLPSVLAENEPSVLVFDYTI